MDIRNLILEKIRNKIDINVWSQSCSSVYLQSSTMLRAKLLDLIRDHVRDKVDICLRVPIYEPYDET